MNLQIANKIIHYNLNCDYQLENCSIENQTNYLINNIMYNFIKTYKNVFKKKIFIYEYNDDIPSLIGLTILQNIQPFQKFNFYLFGKAKKTKEYIKNVKFYSKWKLKKNKDKIILISSFNPIYKVSDNKYKSNKFINPDYYLINRFTPDELHQSRLFYHIGYIKNDILNYKYGNLINFNNSINDLSKNNDIILKDKELIENKIPKVLFVWIESNKEKLEETTSLMQDIEQSDDLIFYFFNGNPSIIYDKTFNLLLKRTTNRPNSKFLNINNYDLPINLIKDMKLPYDFIGNWDIGKLKDLTTKCEL